jgi:glycine cleavage system H protein
MPPLIEVPNSSCRIATDRVYSIEHVWVKSLESDIVAMGITTTMVEILAEPYKIALPPIGLTVKRDDIFGEIEGYKLRADLLAPVGGTVIQTNDFLKAFSGAAFIGPIESDPYVSGWMVVFKLSNPAELGDLLSPESYRQRVKPDPTES